MMHPSSRLTNFQQKIAAHAVVDLSNGYPQTKSLNERWHRYRHIIDSFDVLDSRQGDEVADTLTTVREILGLDPVQAVIPTNSGSVSLARTLAALSDGRRALVTAPGFDSIHVLATEATGLEPVVISLDPFADHHTRVRAVVDAITDDIGIVVVMSPDNPSGLTLELHELEELGRRCANHDATLVIDQSFALVTPYGPRVTLGTVLADSCKWCVLWDTSKVVELTGEKLGFIIPSAAVAQPVTQAVQTIQLELPTSLLRAIRMYLQTARETAEFEQLNGQIRESYLKVAELARTAGLRINAPEAGSFVILDTEQSPLAMDSDSLAARMLSSGVAVTPSSVLVPEGVTIAGNFVRISLAHSSDHIEVANAVLAEIIAERRREPGSATLSVNTCELLSRQPADRSS